MIVRIASSQFDRSLRRGFITLALVVTAACSIVGCSRVDRSLQVTSNPPGALVYLNGQESGRTPMNKSFVWYGTYDVQLRKEGYKTLTTKEKVWAPWWQVPPIDFVADLLPFPLHDQHKKSYTLTPVTDSPEDTADLLARGERLREQLQSSREKETRAKQDEAVNAAATKAAGEEAPSTKPQ
jgi:hypothetical protein